MAVIAGLAFFKIKDWKVWLHCVIIGIIASAIRGALYRRFSTPKYNDEVVKYVSGFKYKQ